MPRPQANSSSLPTTPCHRFGLGSIQIQTETTSTLPPFGPKQALIKCDGDAPKGQQMVEGGELPKSRTTGMLKDARDFVLGASFQNLKSDSHGRVAQTEAGLLPHSELAHRKAPGLIPTANAGDSVGCRSPAAAWWPHHGAFHVATAHVAEQLGQDGSPAEVPLLTVEQVPKPGTHALPHAGTPNASAATEAVRDVLPASALQRRRPSARPTGWRKKMAPS